MTLEADILRWEGLMWCCSPEGELVPAEPDEDEPEEGEED